MDKARAARREAVQTVHTFLYYDSDQLPLSCLWAATTPFHRREALRFANRFLHESWREPSEQWVRMMVSLENSCSGAIDRYAYHGFNEEAGVLALDCPNPHAARTGALALAAVGMFEKASTLAQRGDDPEHPEICSIPRIYVLAEQPKAAAQSVKARIDGYLAKRNFERLEYNMRCLSYALSAQAGDSKALDLLRDVADGEGPHGPCRLLYADQLNEGRRKQYLDGLSSLSRTQTLLMAELTPATTQAPRGTYVVHSLSRLLELDFQRYRPRLPWGLVRSAEAALEHVSPDPAVRLRGELRVSLAVFEILSGELTGAQTYLGEARDDFDRTEWYDIPAQAESGRPAVSMRDYVLGLQTIVATKRGDLNKARSLFDEISQDSPDHAELKSYVDFVQHGNIESYERTFSVRQRESKRPSSEHYYEAVRQMWKTAATGDGRRILPYLHGVGPCGAEARPGQWALRLKTNRDIYVRAMRYRWTPRNYATDGPIFHITRLARLRLIAERAGAQAWEETLSARISRLRAAVLNRETAVPRWYL